MEQKFIAGSTTLEQIESAIRYEETAFAKATGSTIATQSGQPGNKITFEHVSLPAKRLKLQLTSAKAPADHDKAWSANMVLAGETHSVTAWRAKAMTKVATSRSTKKPSFTPQVAALPELRPHSEPSRFSVKGAVLHDADGAPTKQLASPNQSPGISPKYLVIHYTGGTTLEGTVSWFMNPAAKASAHFVVARDGGIVQMVSLDRRAWHAGVSEWEGIKGLNAHSIGIEIVNGGKLRRTARGWVTWAEREISADEVSIAKHQHETSEAGWHEYTAEQISAVLELCVALHAALGFKDVLGHDDIALGRKADPGPAFPIGALRSHIFGRE